jgi:L-iditol 2-dehydrogenase
MKESMLAAVFHGPNDLRVETVAIPRIKPDELLLRNLNANICGTDLRILHGSHRNYPKGTVRIPGHEVVSEIAEVGSRVVNYSLGQRVFVAPNIGVSYSRQTISGNNNLDPNFDAFGITLDGAFAEYMHVPAEFIRQGNLMIISETIDPAIGALIEPLACVLRGQNAVNLHSGDVVVIMGAGPMGILHLMLARFSGAAQILVSEPAHNRRAQSSEFGADCVIDPINEDIKSEVMNASQGRGADVIIVATPSKSAQESALELAAIGGRVNLFGGLPKEDPLIKFNSNIVHYKELIVTGTTACSTYDCMRAADLVNAGCLDLSPLITSRFPLKEANTAFRASEDGRNLRVTLEI